MEYCPGGDLGKLLRKQGKLDEATAKVYIAEILLSIQYLHKREIIFRDLKPDNVVLDSDGHCKLTDFGLSKEGIIDNISARSFCGSLAYLAPEILAANGHGKSVDWYLLGVLLYEMLTGRTPYYSTNKDQLIENIENGELYLPRELSNAAKSIMLQLMDRDPNSRLGADASDAESIKKHIFFADVDWSQIANRQATVPPVQLREINEEAFNLRNSVFADLCQGDGDSN